MEDQSGKQPKIWQAEAPEPPLTERLPEADIGNPAEMGQKRKTPRKFRSRKLVLSALILLLGTAIYFNWKFVSEPVKAPEESSVRYFGEAELAGTEVSVAQEDAVLAAARTQRRQQIDTAKTELLKQSRDENLPGEVRKKAGEQLTDLTRRQEACAQMETRILAKGVTDCMVYYDGKTAHVLVKCAEKELHAETVVAIRDVVLSVTELPASSVTVAEVRSQEEPEETESD